MTRVGVANLGNGSAADVRMTLDRLKARGVRVAGLEEAGDRRPVVEDWCRDNGWTAFFGDGAEGAASTPLVWDRRVDVANPGTRPATPPTNCGPLGAGPNTVKAKVWNHVRVRDAGLSFVFVNGHLPASLYLPRRRALARRQLAVLETMVRHRKGRVPVVVVGDFNARPNALVLRPLRKLGMRQHTHQATHGKRTIDLTWTLGLDAHAEVVNIPSDHKAVVLTLKENS